MIAIEILMYRDDELIVWVQVLCLGRIGGLLGA
jgi:hypothetical protein